MLHRETSNWNHKLNDYTFLDSHAHAAARMQPPASGGSKRRGLAAGRRQRGGGRKPARHIWDSSGLAHYGKYGAARQEARGDATWPETRLRGPDLEENTVAQQRPSHQQGVDGQPSNEARVAGQHCAHKMGGNEKCQ